MMKKKTSVSDLFLSKQISEVKKLSQLGLAGQKDLAEEITEIKRLLVLVSNRVPPELEAAINETARLARVIDQKVKD